jgi:hypothetical protein
MEYTWKIKSLIKQNTNDLDNVIVGTRWTVTGTNEDGITGTFSGATPLTLDSVDPNNFTTFENLTEAQVLGWIQNTVSGSSTTSYWDHISGRIEKEIEEKINVKIQIEEMELPWSGSAE